MSLDVYLTTHPLTEDQIAEIRASNLSGDTMAAVFALVENKGSETVFDRNTTHNHTGIADAVGVYRCCWRPDQNGITKAKQLIEPLRAGLALLTTQPEKYRHLEPGNGWGSVQHFTEFVAAYLRACEQWPEADVRVSR